MVAMERPSSLVPRKPRLPPLEATGEKPLFFFAVVALLNIVDAFNLNIVWPMLPFMVESFGVAKSEADLGAWVGAAGAAVSVGQLMSSYAWGALSDRIGRRPVLLMGMFNSTFSVLVFGTATTYTQVRVYEGLHFQIPRLFGPITTTVTLSRYERLTLLLQSQCLVGRFLSGLLNGNAGVVKTYVGETTNKSQRTFAFSVFALAFGTASVLAPAIGGFLQQPASTWPAVFGSTVFETYPFLLPMLCAAFLTFTGGVLGFLYAPETASQWRRMEKRRLAKEATRVTGAGGVEIDDEEKKLLPAEVEMTERSERDGCVSVAQVVSHVDCEWIDPEGEDPSLGEKKLNRGDDAATRLKLWREISSSSRIDGTDRDLKTEALHINGWNHDTATAASCYALLAFIAIGYDEILPVYAKTSQGMGGLGFNPAQIGTVLIVGGVFLIGFQLAVFPKLLVRAFSTLHIPPP
jgi:diphthamide biosynthesis protein 2|tara:strand:- start:36 stop:1424 length:1389 start_codon:yes stop_codon:yes gene_type:complete